MQFDSGYFIIPRGYLDELDAEMRGLLVFLIERARWKEGSGMSHGVLVSQGEVPYSLRWLSKELSRPKRPYGRTKAKNGVTFLQKCGFISLTRATPEPVLRINNFEAFRPSYHDSDTQACHGRATDVPEASRERAEGVPHKEEGKKGRKKEGKTNTIPATSGEPEAPVQTDPTKIKHPWPVPHSNVLLSETDAATLVKRCGSVECAHYIAVQLDRLKYNEPLKFRKYKDHLRTLLNWHERRISEGKVFFNHRDRGPNYYPQWMMKDFILTDGPHAQRTPSDTDRRDDR